jgi:cbb3-type cytochrome oxidase subunit 3
MVMEMFGFFLVLLLIGLLGGRVWLFDPDRKEE